MALGHPMLVSARDAKRRRSWGLGVPAGQFFALYFVSSNGNTVTQRAHIVVSAGLTIIFFYSD